jgi:ribosomal protein L40E
MDIIQTFLHSTNQFTSISVKSVREKQVKLNNVEQIHDLLNDSVIRWDKTQPFTVIFTHSYDPLFVYKTPKDVPKSLPLYFNALAKKSNRWLSNATNDIFTDYNQLSHLDLFYKLVSLSNKYWNKAICTQCFNQYPYESSICTKCKSSLIKPESFNTDHIKKFQTQMSQLLEKEYVITPDNYIKMLLVWLRISSDLPVIIMGETGKFETNIINLHL